METTKFPYCQRFPQSVFCDFWHALFPQLCPGGFKNFYQYYSNSSSGNHEFRNKLPELDSCSQTPANEKYFYIIFLSFR